MLPTKNNDNSVQIGMPCYCRQYRRSPLCRWGLHFDSHKRSHILSSSQVIGLNTILLQKTYTLSILVSFEALLRRQCFIIVER